MMLPVRSERLLPVSSNSTVSFCCFAYVIFLFGVLVGFDVECLQVCRDWRKKKRNGKKLW